MVGLLLIKNENQCVSQLTKFKVKIYCRSGLDRLKFYTNPAQNMSEYGFSLNRLLPYKERMIDSVGENPYCGIFCVVKIIEAFNMIRVLLRVIEISLTKRHVVDLLKFFVRHGVRGITFGIISVITYG